MNPVMTDWLTLLFAPIGVILLVVAFVKARPALKAGEPAPAWTKVVQGLGAACVLLVALLNVLGN
jgi:hypothetical protein